jgi:hypothetical protein
MIEGELGFCDEYDPLDPNFFEADEIEARRAIAEEARAQLEPFYAHLAAIGCLRVDDPTKSETPSFYLVVGGQWRAPDYIADGDGQPWPNFGMIECAMASIPGANFIATGIGEYVDQRETFDLLHSVTSGQEIAAWGGEPTPGLLPKTDESCEDWLARVAVPVEKLIAVFDRLVRVGYDLGLYSLFFEPEDVSETEWLVDGVIGFGVLTLLVGCGAAGKSSALHELISATNAVSGPKTFFGRNVTGRYPGVLLSGEETRGALKYRQERHAKVWRGAEPMVIDGADSEDLRNTLIQLERFPGRGLLVIDPVTTYLDGDETKTHVVSEFYGPLVAFARRKGWAVVVAHHLVKDPPKNLSRILASVKGATVHTDRARMVIAMIDRQNGTVEVGPIKHNYPEGAWLKINEGQFLRRDPETFRLLTVEAELPKAPQAESELLAQILEVIARLNGEDVTVHRTGGSGLYKLQPAELQGVPRNVIESGILSLLDAGRLINTAKGLVAVQATQSPQPAPVGASQ